MKMSAILLLLTLGAGCRRPIHPQDPSGRLKNTMAVFLKNSLGKDSGSVKFDVQEVSFFEDKDFYECEFRVRMTNHRSDTTGIMQARITKDFSTVTRKW